MKFQLVTVATINLVADLGAVEEICEGKRREETLAAIGIALVAVTGAINPARRT